MADCYPGDGGQTYRFETWRRTRDIHLPRRSAVVRLRWQNETGGSVLRDEPTFPTYRPGDIPQAEPEYVHDTEQRLDEWVLVAGTFSAPKPQNRSSSN